MESKDINSLENIKDYKKSIFIRVFHNEKIHKIKIDGISEIDGKCKDCSYLFWNFYKNLWEKYGVFDQVFIYYNNLHKRIVFSEILMAPFVLSFLYTVSLKHNDGTKRCNLYNILLKEIEKKLIDINITDRLLNLTLWAIQNRCPGTIGKKIRLDLKQTTVFSTDLNNSIRQHTRILDGYGMLCWYVFEMCYLSDKRNNELFINELDCCTFYMDYWITILNDIGSFKKDEYNNKKEFYIFNKNYKNLYSDLISLENCLLEESKKLGVLNEMKYYLSGYYVYFAFAKHTLITLEEIINITKTNLKDTITEIYYLYKEKNNINN